MVAYSTDEELVRKCQSELPYQTTSFEILVTRYKDKVFAKAANMLRNKDDASDVTQEVFLQVFSNLPSFRLDSSFSTWLYSIAVNRCLSYIETRKRRPWWWLTVDIEEFQAAQQEEEALFLLVGQSTQKEDLRKIIDRTFERLSDLSREILTLRYIEEMDLKSISAELGIGLSAAKMRLGRAREEFIKKYQQVSQGKLHGS